MDCGVATAKSCVELYVNGQLCMRVTEGGERFRQYSLDTWRGFFAVFEARGVGIFRRTEFIALLAKLRAECEIGLSALAGARRLTGFS